LFRQLFAGGPSFVFGIEQSVNCPSTGEHRKIAFSQIGGISIVIWRHTPVANSR
jgi:hypothetical protein